MKNLIPSRDPDLRAPGLWRWLTVTAVPALLAAGCSEAEPEPEPGVEPPAVERSTESGFQSNTYERNFVFLTTRADTMLAVPWLISARSHPGGVDRSARAWLARGGAWEAFMDERWSTPETRVPWRILPRGSMRLVVGDGESLDRILFEDGARQLHVILGVRLVDWGGQGGETFRISEGSLALANQVVPGVVLDMTRARRTDSPPPGDWAILTSGDSVQVMLYRPVEGPAGAPDAWRGWSRGGFGELQWPRVTVTWQDRRSFERARREIPVLWGVRSAEGEAEGTLEATATEIEADEGDGPQLPVQALFLLDGVLNIGGSEYPVRGLLRHRQR